MNWKTIRADEFCKSVRDGTHDTPKPTETGHKLVTGKHVKNGQIDPSDAYYISEKDYKKINERSLVEQWDVLMSMIGTVGEVAVVKDHPNYAIKKDQVNSFSPLINFAHYLFQLQMRDTCRELSIFFLPMMN